MASSKPTLGYWDIRGLGAPIRHLLAYLKVDYVDKRYTDPNEWFAKDKFSETLSLSFPNVCYKLYFLNDLLIFSFFVAGSEQLPYYIDGEVRLTQTLAILRYLGNKYHLDGANEKEKVAISLVEQQIQDMNSGMVRVSYDPAWEKLKEDYLKGLPANLKLLSNYLGEKPFVAGTSFSYVDSWMYEFLKKVSIMVPGSLDSTPNLSKFITRFEQLPQFAESSYFKSAKPQTFNGPSAFWNASA